MIKCGAKQKHSLPVHYANNELKEIHKDRCIIKISNKIKDIDIKNGTYYFFNDIINIKSFDPDKTKIDENSYKNILIYYIGHVTIKYIKYVKVNSVNPLHIIFSKVNGYFEEVNKC